MDYRELTAGAASFTAPHPVLMNVGTLCSVGKSLQANRTLLTAQGRKALRVKELSRGY